MARKSRIDTTAIHRALERGARRPLYRSTTNKWVFGVCGGLAEAFHVNPSIVRAATAIACVIVPQPLVLLAYLILVLILPKR